MKLYLKKKPKSLLEATYKLIIKQGATYLDKERKQKHTKKGKYRSLKDLRLVLKTYYPDITNKEINKLVKEMDYNLLIYTDFCPDIRRKVLYPRSLLKPSFENFKKSLNESSTENSTVYQSDRHILRV